VHPEGTVRAALQPRRRVRAWQLSYCCAHGAAADGSRGCGPTLRSYPLLTSREACWITRWCGGRLRQLLPLGQARLQHSPCWSAPSSRRQESRLWRDALQLLAGSIDGACLITRWRGGRPLRLLPRRLAGALAVLAMLLRAEQSSIGVAAVVRRFAAPHWWRRVRTVRDSAETGALGRSSRNKAEESNDSLKARSSRVRCRGSVEMASYPVTRTDRTEE